MPSRAGPTCPKPPLPWRPRCRKRTIGCGSFRQLEAGLRPRTPGRLVQECGIGLVSINIDADGTLAFRAPEASLTELHAALYPAVRAALGGASFGAAAPVVASMGITWLVVRMDSAAACLAVKPDAAGLAALTAHGLLGIAMFGCHPAGGPADYEVRVIFPKGGVLTEDPVTGSANACIARVLQAQGFPDGPASAAGYSARQGVSLGCDGRITVRFADGAPWIGGHSVTVIDGQIAV